MGLLSPVRVDSLSSWLVAVGCFIILALTIGVARTLPFFMPDWAENLDGKPPYSKTSGEWDVDQGASGASMDAPGVRL